MISWYKKTLWNLKASLLYYMTVRLKRCNFGPFTGEFGHLLGHNLPFIAHLYSRGVKVNFCGMEIHKPFFVDENGNEIVSSYVALRDFFNESAPDCNQADAPNDVSNITSNFVTTAKRSIIPYWDNSNHVYYYYFFRDWILNRKYIKAFDLSKVYKTADEDAVVIFPRRRNMAFPDPYSKQRSNNGEDWNYYEVAKVAARHFKKVYVIGHPVFSVEMEPFENVEVCLTNDNALILEKCCNSKLIISQHSGSVYLGEYTNSQVLIIYKGGNQIGEIDATQRFKKSLGEKYDFNYAFSLDEINSYLSNFKKKDVGNLKKNEAIRN